MTFRDSCHHQSLLLSNSSTITTTTTIINYHYHHSLSLIIIVIIIIHSNSSKYLHQHKNNNMSSKQNTIIKITIFICDRKLFSILDIVKIVGLVWENGYLKIQKSSKVNLTENGNNITQNPQMTAKVLKANKKNSH